MNDNQNSDNSSLISLIEVSESELENESVNQMVGLIEIEENRKEKKGNEVTLKNLQRAVRNWRKCLGCNEKENLHRPSKKMRLYFCKSKKIYIQENDRVCNYHTQCENWDKISFNAASNFSSKIVDEVVSFLLNPPVHEFDNSSTQIDIGLTNLQFKQVLRELGLPQKPDKNQKRLILAVRLYMQRLRQGHTYAQMAIRYNLSRQTIGKKVKCGRNFLLQNFVPNHLGCQNHRREWLKNHTTDFARLLYCHNDPEKCVIICDGTYIYTCNTSNYLHQRKIYSGQKRRHLIKIMKIVSVDGSILDVFGPFPATKNDADILKIVFEKTSIENVLKAGDVILVDRGFRDCIKYLQDKHFDLKIPEFIQKGEKGQLTTKQANKSRLVTKMRFAIEAANGRMKNKWHLFGKLLPSILIKNLMSDYKIGAAMLNAFAKPIECDKDDFSNIGARMISLVNTKNELRPIINSKSFKRTKKLYFQLVEPYQLNFPRFNQEQLKNFSLGTYAIRQAISYTADHIKLHGQFKIYTLPINHVHAHFGRICSKDNYEKPMFISAEIKSRFRSRQTHNVYIFYDFTVCEQSKFMYLCDCQHGQRTVGCCSHVMTVVWYFGCGRYERAIDPASHLNDFFNNIT